MKKVLIAVVSLCIIGGVVWYVLDKKNATECSATECCVKADSCCVKADSCCVKADSCCAKVDSVAVAE